MPGRRNQRGSAVVVLNIGIDTGGEKTIHGDDIACSGGGQERLAVKLITAQLQKLLNRLRGWFRSGC